MTINRMASTTEYDLSGRICASLDKHLALAILEFLASRASSGASADAIREAKLAVVEKTYMCDYAVDLYCEARQTKDVRTILGFVGVFHSRSFPSFSFFSRCDETFLLSLVSPTRGNIDNSLAVRRVLVDRSRST
jgi:hypothetical protein